MIMAVVATPSLNCGRMRIWSLSLTFLPLHEDRCAHGSHVLRAPCSIHSQTWMAMKASKTTGRSVAVGVGLFGCDVLVPSRLDGRQSTTVIFGDQQGEELDWVSTGPLFVIG